MASGEPDFTKRMKLYDAFGHTDKLLTYEAYPWAWDSDNDRLKVAIEYATGVTFDVSDRWARLLGQVDITRVLGATHSKTNTLFAQLSDGTDVYVGAKTGQLPTALDSGALKIKEQSPITGFATSANQTTIIGHIDTLETLLADVPIASSVSSGENADVDTTAEQVVAASTPCKGVIIQAKASNTGIIYVGDDSNLYLELKKEDNVPIETDDVNNIYVKASVANQGVNFFWWN